MVLLWGSAKRLSAGLTDVGNAVKLKDVGRSI